MALPIGGKKKDLFESNRFLIFFSAFCAVVLWIFISVNNVKDIEKTFSVPINVNISSDSALSNMGLGLIDQSEPNVMVTVRGDKFTISKITADDFDATAVLSGVFGPGTSTLPITVKIDSNETNFEIVETTVKYIQARFDRMTEKEFDLSADLIGLKVADGMWKESHLPEAKTVKLTGPETDINKIAKVVARANVNKTLDATASFDADIVYFDESDQEITSKYIKPGIESTKVIINILKKKTVPVKVGFTTTPAAYVTTAISHTLSAKSLELAGPAETIDQLSELEVGKIDFAKLDIDSNVFTFELKLPSGVVSTGNVTAVTATVNTSDLQVKYLTVTNIQVGKVNLADKHVEIITQSIANVKIIGKRSEIRSIAGKDLTAYVDVTGQESLTGEAQAPVLISSERYPSCWANGSYMASVKIS